MTISEVPLAVLNRFAAEKLGWRIEQEPYGSFSSRYRVFAPDGHEVGWSEEPDYQFRLLPDLTQGDGMKMLLERLLWNDDYTVLFDREEIECSVTQKAWERGKRGGFILKIQSRELFARAVVEAFCLSEGFQVEEA